MSAGNITGLIVNLVFFIAIWSVVGIVVDKIGAAFNRSIVLMPTMQDAVNGFHLTQIIYGILPLIMFLVLLINYFVNENAQSSGEV